MENTQSHLISAAEPTPVNGSGTTPFAQQTVVLTQQASIERTWQAHDWQAQYERRLKRAAALQTAGEAREAPIRDLKQRLYGTTSEQSSGPDDAGASRPARPSNRGQQPGSQGHGRRDRAALPAVAEVQDVSAAEQYCSACGEACVPLPGAEESSLIAVQVQAHMRRSQRQRDQKTCGCPQVSGLVPAPPAPRVIPQSPLGVSVWTMVLLDTYLSGRPTHRFCEALRPPGLHRSQGTLPDGLQRIAVRCEPVMPALSARQRRAKLCRGDATRWEGCAAEGEGKTGHRWSLWVRPLPSVVFSIMAPGRGAEVPIAHGAGRRKDLVDVVLVGDR